MSHVRPGSLQQNLKDHIDPDQVAALAGEIARTDAAEFRNQYPGAA
jgi:hypothetical protein